MAAAAAWWVQWVGGGGGGCGGVLRWGQAGRAWAVAMPGSGRRPLRPPVRRPPPQPKPPPTPPLHPHPPPPPQSRPFGVALLLAGWDASGPRLYQTDPSGTYVEYGARAIGSGSEGAQTALQEAWKDDMSLAEAEVLALATLKQVTEGEGGGEGPGGGGWEGVEGGKGWRVGRGGGWERVEKSEGRVGVDASSSPPPRPHPCPQPRPHPHPHPGQIDLQDQSFLINKLYYYLCRGLVVVFKSQNLY